MASQKYVIAIHRRNTKFTDYVHIMPFDVPIFTSNKSEAMKVEHKEAQRMAKIVRKYFDTHAASVIIYLA